MIAGELRRAVDPLHDEVRSRAASVSTYRYGSGTAKPNRCSAASRRYSFAVTVRPCCLKSTARCRRKTTRRLPPSGVAMSRPNTSADTPPVSARQSNELTTRLQLSHRLLDAGRDLDPHDATPAWAPDAHLVYSRYGRGDDHEDHHRAPATASVPLAPMATRSKTSSSPPSTPMSPNSSGPLLKQPPLPSHPSSAPNASASRPTSTTGWMACVDSGGGRDLARRPR